MIDPTYTRLIHGVYWDARARAAATFCGSALTPAQQAVLLADDDLGDVLARRATCGHCLAHEDLCEILADDAAVPVPAASVTARVLATLLAVDWGLVAARPDLTPGAVASDVLYEHELSDYQDEAQWGPVVDAAHHASRLLYREARA